jgi:copper chaperone CopZ
MVQRISDSAVGALPGLLVSASLATPSPPARAQKSATTPAMSTRVLRIDDMSTPACPVRGRAAVRGLDGVQSVEAGLERHTATVTFDAGKTSPRAIQQVIKDRVGFEASLPR